MAKEKTFAELGLSDALLRGLSALALRLPTEIQLACIPPILQGRDCIGSARTGSGKTMAFALPILQALSEDPHGLFAVVLTPTRELAYQIHEQFVALSSAIHHSSAVIVGGMDMMAQAIDMAKRPHVIIATPGRLVDLVKTNAGEWSLGRARFLVLDEADRLLAPSFANDLGVILKEMPPSRQTLLFTATVTDPILALERREPAAGKQKPFMHLIGDSLAIPQTLRQLYVFVPSQVRDVYVFYLLAHLARLTDTTPMPSKKEMEEGIDPLPQCILFVSRCRTAAQLSVVLIELGIPNAALHSQLSQRARLASLAAFRAQRLPLLVATDVGSRGLDIPAVECVINYDVPREPDDYIHRVGRTARAGRRGVSVTMVCEGDVDLVHLVEERVGGCFSLSWQTVSSALTGQDMNELELPEDKVLDQLNKVSTAQRVAMLVRHCIRSVLSLFLSMHSNCILRALAKRKSATS